MRAPESLEYCNTVNTVNTVECLWYCTMLVGMLENTVEWWCSTTTQLQNPKMYSDAPAPQQQRPSTGERAQGAIDCPASARPRPTTIKPGLGHYLPLQMLTMHLVEVATQACCTTLSEHLSWYFVWLYIMCCICINVHVKHKDRKRLP